MRRIKAAYFKILEKYQTALLFIVGCYLFVKGLIEARSGVQLPQSRFLEEIGEGIEQVYSIIAISMGMYFIFQHMLVEYKWWYSVTRNLVYLSFLFQIWVAFVTFTSEPPYNLFGLGASVVAFILGSVYVRMGVDHGIK